MTGKIASDSVKLEPSFQSAQSPSPSDGSGSTVTPLPFPNTPQAVPPSRYSSELHQTQLPELNPVGDFAPNPSFMQDANIQQMPSLYRSDTIPSLSHGSSLNTHFEGSTVNSAASAPSTYSPGQSPRLIDLLLPGTDLSTPPDYSNYGQPQQDIPYMDENVPDVKIEGGNYDEDDEIEEIPRLLDHNWLIRQNSPTLSSSKSDSPSFEAPTFMFNQPKFDANSPEMIIQQFDRNTCGILSVRDGPTENPWRTIVYPLARDSPALFHAISSMTAFHSSRLTPNMKIHGMDHMRRSIEALVSGINNMPTDTALATTLVLAFAESWDVHISTGIKHLQGAKALMHKALTTTQKRTSQETARMRFLFNTWVYMDVIARLTSVDFDESNDFETALWPEDILGTSVEIDPLMGCAATLFPLIGRVANLVRKVRTVPNNSIDIISQASEMKSKIEAWMPPAFFSQPEDPTCEIQNALQTAEAYRWATLLYLHQAVPELPSRTAGTLANKVLVCLATVPLTSRTVIVHIYPLLAAGCEASRQEDRDWVRDRWLAMSARMQIGNIDRCLEVVKEVWHRRDQAKAELRARAQTAAPLNNTVFQSSAPSFKRTYTVETDPLSTWNMDASMQSHPKRVAIGDQQGMPVVARMDTTGSSAIDDQDSIFWSDAGTNGSRHASLDTEIPTPQQPGSQMTSPMDEEASLADDGNWNDIMSGGVNRPIRNGSFGSSLSNGRRVSKGSQEFLEDMNIERTVRGSQHWVGVMKDWQWEGMSVSYLLSSAPHPQVQDHPRTVAFHVVHDVLVA